MKTLRGLVDSVVLLCYVLSMVALTALGTTAVSALFG